MKASEARRAVIDVIDRGWINVQSHGVMRYETIIERRYPDLDVDLICTLYGDEAWLGYDVMAEKVADAYIDRCFFDEVGASRASARRKREAHERAVAEDRRKLAEWNAATGRG